MRRSRPRLPALVRAAGRRLRDLPRGADERGQAIVLVALLATVLMGFIGLVVDIGWFQLNLVRVQRAADAGALAGAVYLPGNVGGAVSAALNATAQNGYANGVGGVTVRAQQDPTNPQLLNVTVGTPVRTWFMRVFGVNSMSASRNARAEFILPVPMGSPLAYFGVHILCPNGAASVPGGCSAVPSATGSGTLASQGFWAGIEAKGTQRANGDGYSTYFDAPEPGGLNASYDPLGYSYIVEFPAGTTDGKVFIFDPGFCATGAGTSGVVSGRRLGAGDFFLGPHTGITTEYALWDMNGTPYDTTDDILIASDGGLFRDLDAVDKGPTYRGDQSYGYGYDGSASTDCQTSPYHNAWWQLGPSGLTAGQYRLQVRTSGGTTSQNAVNNFAIQATASVPGARVYGQSRMCAFNALSGTSTFYLAQIAAVHAGKTLEIKLFDPGDIANTSLKVKLPTSTGYTDATFSWTATGCSGSGCSTSGTNVTSIVTSTPGGTNYFNDQWVTLSVVLPTTYDAPTPPGEPGPGWFKIQYITTGTGQDVTTWSVNIRGNPVHLVTP